jgi:hypothetical protein
MRSNRLRPRSPGDVIAGGAKPPRPGSVPAASTSKAAPAPAVHDAQKSKARAATAAPPSSAAAKTTAKANTTAASDATAGAASSSSSTTLIVVGTYNHAVVGYTVTFDRAAVLARLRGPPRATPPVASPIVRFTATQHNGCVHSVAGNGSSLVASAGSDERIALCSLRNHGTAATDLGSMQPASTVRCLEFVRSGGGHLLCGCDDGSLAVYRTRTWECVAVVRVHEKPLLSFAVTANGALCMTLGQDRLLAFVDLMRGSVLLKHKFAPATATLRRKDAASLTASAAATSDALGAAAAAAAAAVTQRQRFGFVNQPPRQVVLSPSGRTVAVVAPYYVCFFDLRSAALIATVEVDDAQPENELQCAAFVRSSPPPAAAGSSGDSNNTGGAASESWHLVVTTEGGACAALAEPSTSNVTQTSPRLAWSDVTVRQVPQLTSATFVTASSLPPSSARASSSAAAVTIAASSASPYDVRSTRVRAIASIGGGAASGDGLVTGASNGELRCWIAVARPSAASDEDGSTREATAAADALELIEMAAAINVGGRITCLAAAAT